MSGGGEKLVFEVGHFSSQEDKFPASELSRSLAASRGWQSRRHAAAPHVIVLDLGAPCAITHLALLAHECKTPQRAAVHVSADNMLERAEFASLGFVSFQHNRDGHFKSGELKSVRLDTTARFVKLVLDGAHANDLNFQQQVGLHTVMLSGPRTNFRPPADVGPGRDDGRRDAGDASLSAVEKLTLDLKYDPFVFGRIKELENAKHVAAAAEDFLAATVLKEQIDALYPIAMQVRECEAMKRAASLEEDYQLAQQLKAEIDDLRARALAIHGGQPQIRQMASPSPTVARMPSPAMQRTQGPPQPQFATPAASPGHQAPAPQTPPPATGPADVPFDERPAMATGNAMMSPSAMSGGAAADAPPTAGGGGFGGASNAAGGGGGGGAAMLSRAMLSESDLAMARKLEEFAGGAQELPEDARPLMKDVPSFSDMLSTLGLYTTCAAFSRRHILRESALRCITHAADFILQQVSANDVVTAALIVATTRNSGLADRVNSVFRACIEMIQHCLKGKFHGDCDGALRRFQNQVITGLLQRVGDSNEKVREDAVATLQEMMVHRAVGLAVVGKAVTTGKHSPAVRTWVSRLILVEHALTRVLPPRAALDEGPLEFEGLMKSLLHPALHHAQATVREKAIDVLCHTSPRVGRAAIMAHVEKWKPTLRNAVERRLDNAPDAQPSGHSPSAKGGAPAGDDDEPPSPAAPKIRRKPAPKRKPAAPAPQQASDDDAAEEDAEDIVAVHPPRRKVGPSSDPGLLAVGDEEEEVAEDAEPQPPRRQQPPPVVGQCQFCGLADPSFADHEELVQHFKAECPMLCNCPFCLLPIEIREINDHLVADCEKRQRVKRCPRCRCAVRLDAFDEHVKAKKCTAFSPDSVVCPLCQTRLPDIDSLWTAHIMEPPYCSGNTRTIVD